MDRNFKNGGFVNRAEFLSNLSDQYGMSLGDIKELAENLSDSQLKKQLEIGNRKQSKSREIVTSENREEYMEKKMAEKSGKKPAKKVDEQFERVKNHPKYAMLKIKLGKKGAMDALLKELNDKQ